jgi:hypothetical protein
MKIVRDKVGLIAAVALLVGAAACGNKSRGADAGLAADLKAAGGNGIELAPVGNPWMVVVSPLEGGPQAAPKKAAPQRVYKPAPRAESRVASEAQPTPQAAPAPAQAMTPSTPAPQPAPAEPAPAAANRPAPVQAQERQPGVYKSEGEIFRKMPWIRP